MPLIDLVAPNAIIPALKVVSKKQVLQELSAKAAKLTGLNERVIFETLLLSDGRVHALDAHLARLQRSVAELYGTSLTPQARAQLITRLTEAAADTPGERRARIDAVPDNGRLQLSIAVSDAPDRRPVTLGPVVVPGGLGAHKWRDRRLVERIPGGAVPLIIDGDGSVLEAAWANIWLLDGDRLVPQ